MRTSNSAGLWITACLGLAILAACSIGGSRLDPATFEQTSGVPPAASLHRGVRHSMTTQTPSFMDPKAVYKPLVFVAGANANFVDIFLQGDHNKQVGQITGLATPGALATDAARNLYVVNVATSNVPVYAPPYTGAPAMTLDDTANSPGWVAVSPKGVIAVTNVSVNPCCQQGTGGVSFYAKNSTTACKILFADPSKFWYMGYAAFDHAGNLYITGTYGSNAATVLEEVKGGCNARKIEVLSTTNTLNFLGGIQIDKAERIAVLESYCCQGNQVVSDIYPYNPPIKGSLGTPMSTTSLDVPNTTTSFAFVASGKAFYATELGNMSTDYADRFGYPAGGAPEQIITVGGGGDQVFATAVTPPLVP
jgi:hypothetical protein